MAGGLPVVKRILKEFSDWLLLSRAGEILMFLTLIGFCLLVAAMVLIMGMDFDDYHKPQDKPEIDEIQDFEVIRL